MHFLQPVCFAADERSLSPTADSPAKFKSENVEFAFVMADRDVFECLGGMLIFLNTFDECQTDKSPSPSRLFSSVDLSLPFPRTFTSPFVSLLSFWARDFSLFFFFLKPMNPFLFSNMNYWIFICLSCVLQVSHATGLPEDRDAPSRQRKADVLRHVCNDRQQSAFRVPAFIIVNADDTGLLPSWQTVTELSDLHNCRLAPPWSPYNWWVPTFWERLLLCGLAENCVCICYTAFFVIFLCRELCPFQLLAGCHTAAFTA